MSQFKNKYEIKFFGLKRSGNHAIINWLMSYFPEPVWFINCITPYTNPFTMKEKWKAVQSAYKQFRNCKIYYEEPELKTCKKYCLLLSYENFNISELKKRTLLPDQIRNKIGKSEIYKDVLLLRDPFNNLASHWKWKGERVTLQQKGKLLKIWKIYAKEYLGETNYLHNRVGILYNKWFTDEQYRKSKIVNQFGLPYILNDSEKDVIFTSSFNKNKFHKKANQMDVLNRWKEYSGSSKFMNMFDDETKELSEKIFGKII